MGITTQRISIVSFGHHWMWMASIILFLFHRENLKSHTDGKACESTEKVNYGGGLICTVRHEDIGYWQ